MFITIQNFTNIYSMQPFMVMLEHLAKNSTNRKNLHWFDCTKIEGTDCYCDDDAIIEINKMIDSVVIPTTTISIHFFDNGNYHYMSKIWTDRIQKPFDLIVFDHHPDMQPPRFGDILSCGGWVKKTLDENKFIQNIILIGVADNLIDELQEDIKNYTPRLTIIKESNLFTFNPNNLFITNDLYISIDKDVFSPTFASTNWDQGSLTFNALKNIITKLSNNKKILGIDICGERAQDFKALANGANNAQEADNLNNKLNQELVKFFEKFD